MKHWLKICYIISGVISLYFSLLFAVYTSISHILYLWIPLIISFYVFLRYIFLGLIKGKSSIIYNFLSIFLIGFGILLLLSYPLQSNPHLIINYVGFSGSGILDFIIGNLLYFFFPLIFAVIFVVVFGMDLIEFINFNHGERRT
jgi:hypothetical protein